MFAYLYKYSTQVAMIPHLGFYFLFFGKKRNLSHSTWHNDYAMKTTTHSTVHKNTYLYFSYISFSHFFISYLGHHHRPTLHTHNCYSFLQNWKFLICSLHLSLFWSVKAGKFPLFFRKWKIYILFIFWAVQE
jgi:hypothetical protein